MMAAPTTDHLASSHRSRMDQRVRDVVAEHLDPATGSRFWIERAAALGIEPSGAIRGIDDLSRLGEMTPEDLQQRPLLDFIPRRYHDKPEQLIIGQTAGTTGSGTWTAYLPDEFHAAFVEPFAAAAAHVGFPGAESWLFVGPSGPHIIGQAARAIARTAGSAEPFSVDFDPRWCRKLPKGSVGARRYLHHVVEQAMAVVASQPIGVLFSTPPVLLEMAEAMTEAERARVRGVHYGGMAIDEDTLRRLQDEAFPGAVHLAGYGNTLFGCCLEVRTTRGRTLDYYPYGDRLLLETVDEDGTAVASGRVRVTRLDRSMLIVRMLERDHAEQILPTADSPAGFTGPGLRNPQTKESGVIRPIAGLY